jgi:hypothetical protein
MEEEIREVLAENEAKRGNTNNINMFDYVTIPVKEYRQLIEDLERAIAQVNIEKKETMRARAEMYDMERVIEQYKNDLRKLLGLDELKKVGEQDA